MNKKQQNVVGHVSKKDGKLMLNIHPQIGPVNMEVDIEVEPDEIFDEFVGKGIEIIISEKKLGPPIYTEKEWSLTSQETVDEDYKHAPSAAYEAFQDRKFGMRIHWGIYSVLGLDASWPVDATRCSKEFSDIYYTLWQVFNPVQFDAEEWADLADRAGMKFFVFTTKHHDGFCMWDTKTTCNSLKRFAPRPPGIGEIRESEMHFSMMDTDFKRDIVKELTDAFRKRGLGVGLYYSHIDWNDPNFRWDPRNRSFDPTYNSNDNYDDWQAFIAREREQLKELTTNYGPLDYISFDGSWFDLAWEELVDIIKMVRKNQPNCMFRHRGLGPYGDYQTPEHWIPSEAGTDDNRVTKTVWHNIHTLGSNWAWVPNDIYEAKEESLAKLIDTVSKGGGMMLGISPKPNGTFPEETIEVLEWIGDWLKINGEAIYATRAWKQYNEGANIHFTKSKDSKTIFLIHTGWPTDNVESKTLGSEDIATISMIGVKEGVKWKNTGEKVIIHLSSTIKKPCEYAYCFKINLA